MRGNIISYTKDHRRTWKWIRPETFIFDSSIDVTSSPAARGIFPAAGFAHQCAPPVYASGLEGEANSRD